MLKNEIKSNELSQSTKLVKKKYNSVGKTKQT